MLADGSEQRPNTAEGVLATSMAHEFSPPRPPAPIKLETKAARPSPASPPSRRPSIEGHSHPIGSHRGSAKSAEGWTAIDARSRAPKAGARFRPTVFDAARLWLSRWFHVLSQPCLACLNACICSRLTRRCAYCAAAATAAAAGVTHVDAVPLGSHHIEARLPSCPKP